MTKCTAHASLRSVRSLAPVVAALIDDAGSVGGVGTFALASETELACDAQVPSDGGT